MYIPPENSPYSTIDAFTEIEDDLISKFYREESILLIGDFNAKTSNKSDLIDHDVHENEVLDSHDYVGNISDVLYNNNINISRKSDDKNICNNYGYRLLEMCKACNLFILNGRCEGNDKETGAVTCKKSTLVDYALLYVNTLHSLIPRFYVYDYSCLLSDVHSSISVSITRKTNGTVPDNSPTSNNPATTQETSSNYFSDNSTKPKKIGLTINNLQQIENSINNDKIAELIDKLNSSNGPITEQDINNTTNQLNQILVESAILVCGSNKLNKTQQVKPQTEKLPEWFNQNCQTDRKKYQKARKKYNKKKDKDNLASLQNSSKQYKKNPKQRTS